MSDQVLYSIIGVAGGAFVIVLIAYFILNSRLNKADMKRLKQLRAGTQEKTFSADVAYQKLYLLYKKIPLMHRYLLKIRRKLEIIYMQDEYKTRRQAATIMKTTVCV